MKTVVKLAAWLVFGITRKTTFAEEVFFTQCDCRDNFFQVYGVPDPDVFQIRPFRRPKEVNANFYECVNEQEDGFPADRGVIVTFNGGVGEAIHRLTSTASNNLVNDPAGGLDSWYVVLQVHVGIVKVSKLTLLSVDGDFFKLDIEHFGGSSMITAREKGEMILLLVLI